MVRLSLISAVFVIISTTVMSEKIVKFYKIECVHNDKYISNMTCDLKVIGRNLVQSNGFMILKENVTNAKVSGELFKFENRFQPFLINVTFNMCEVSKLKGIEKPLVSTVLKIFERNSNLVKCVHKVWNSSNFSLRNKKS